MPAIALLVALILLAAPVQETVGDVEIVPVTHGSLMLRYQGVVVHVDPWSQGDYGELPMADVLLITDVHQDHLDVEMASRLMGADTVVIAPDAVADEWGGVDVVLANGETTVAAAIGITAVPMYNLERGPAEGQLYHEPGRGNGYLLQMGQQRVYVAGDTACTPEMRALEEVDIAFVPMNLPYTMTPGQAAECVRAFAPRVVIPYHYRGSDLDVFEHGLEGTGIEVRRLEWYPR